MEEVNKRAERVHVRDGQSRDSMQRRDQSLQDWSQPSPWVNGLALSASEEALTTTESSAVLSSSWAEHTAPTEVPRAQPSWGTSSLPSHVTLLYQDRKAGHLVFLCV